MNIIKSLPILKLTLDKSLMTYFMNFGEPKDLYSSIWYIEGPKEKIIVDTGGDARTTSGHGFPSLQINTPENALGEIGLKPSDIDILILTQMHLDHVEFAREFKNAKIIVQRKEYDFAMNPHEAWAGTYIKDMFKDLTNFECVEGDEDIAEGVKVLDTPGHTPGGQSVAVTTVKGTAIICGLCTIKDNFYPLGDLTGAGVITPGIHTNAIDAYDSVKRIKELADIPIPLHDKEYAYNRTIPG